MVPRYGTAGKRCLWPIGAMTLAVSPRCDKVPIPWPRVDRPCERIRSGLKVHHPHSSMRYRTRHAGLLSWKPICSTTSTLQASTSTCTRGSRRRPCLRSPFSDSRRYGSHHRRCRASPHAMDAAARVSPGSEPDGSNSGQVPADSVGPRVWRACVSCRRKKVPCA